MFEGHKFIKEVAHSQEHWHRGMIGWGLIQHEQLATHYFSLSKAEFLGVHVNVFHIKNAAEMKERGTYLFDWRQDSVSKSAGINASLVV